MVFTCPNEPFKRSKVITLLTNETLDELKAYIHKYFNHSETYAGITLFWNQKDRQVYKLTREQIINRFLFDHWECGDFNVVRWFFEKDDDDDAWV